MNSENVIIIGGGLAGLVAAIHCERAGLSPILIEAGDRLGGRVKTDRQEGYQLDYGFQVLLSDYEEARRYLDFDALTLQSFAPGAILFLEGKRLEITDPIRQPSALLNTALSSFASFKDKYLVFQLTRELKKTKREALFAENAPSTLDYLQSYGFSERIISNFFRPFFGGIFLENELRTSSTMFRFVFKMFSEGKALIPAGGMEAIPQQLQHQLSQTSFHFNTKIKTLKGNSLLTESGNKFDFNKLIIATDPAGIVPGLKGQAQTYVSTSNLYFWSETSPLKSNKIALVADPRSRINNFCVLSDIAKTYAPKAKHLLSVTLKETPEEAIPAGFYQEIAEEVQQLTKSNSPLHFLKRYDIPKALPINEDLQYSLPYTQFTLTNDIYLAGDYLLNASLDAAMRSGRLAASAMLDSL